MTNRNPIVVCVLTFVTCFIYHIYWLVSTKTEMNQRGADIPTAWLLLIPFVNLYWLWRWSQGVEKVTQNQMGAAPAFLLTWLVPYVGNGLIQSQFNKLSPA